MSTRPCTSWSATRVRSSIPTRCGRSSHSWAVARQCPPSPGREVLRRTGALERGLAGYDARLAEHGHRPTGVVHDIPPETVDDIGVVGRRVLLLVRVLLGVEEALLLALVVRNQEPPPVACRHLVRIGGRPVRTLGGD